MLLFINQIIFLKHNQNTSKKMSFFYMNDSIRSEILEIISNFQIHGFAKQVKEYTYKITLYEPGDIRIIQLQKQQKEKHYNVDEFNDYIAIFEEDNEIYVIYDKNIKLGMDMSGVQDIQIMKQTKGFVQLLEQSQLIERPFKQVTGKGYKFTIEQFDIKIVEKQKGQRFQQYIQLNHTGFNIKPENYRKIYESFIKGVMELYLTNYNLNIKSY
ncbi:hypothetical protein pb186bvf_012235 [Paramecium bursaria]